MAEPTPPHSVAAPARAGRWRRALAGLASLALVLQVALGLRIVAADAGRSLRPPRRIGTVVSVSRHHRSTGGWLGRFARAHPMNMWNGATSPTSRCARRGTRCSWRPARPFSAERTLAVRLVQAGLGTLSVYLVYRLTRQLAASQRARPSRRDVGVAPLDCAAGRRGAGCD